jgi:hypothetical protein
VDGKGCGLVGSRHRIFRETLAYGLSELHGPSRLTNCALPHVLRGLLLRLLENLTVSALVRDKEQ